MDYRRNYKPGGTFFFTVVTYRRAPLFANPPAIQWLRESVAEVRINRPFVLLAWVILHDHLHMIWRLPPGDADFSARWSSIKSRFTRRWRGGGGSEAVLAPGKVRDRRRGVWQPKFYEHTIRDDEDMIAHVEYIHYNPVKHGYVDRPRDWQWPSFQAYVERGDYPLDWCCGRGEASARELTHDADE